MGPFIVRRPPVFNITPEVQHVADLLRDSVWRERNYRFCERLHRGRFVRFGASQYSHLHCDTCGWDTEGPMIHRYRDDYNAMLEVHREQWRVHRAQMAIAEGLAEGLRVS